ncbi:MAG: GAF domain-containing protein [Bacteroidales bacterium]|nr:GAF domain-containing protein [Bacteroidales bacterium]
MRLNIAAKIGLGFGIITLAVIYNGIKTSNSLKDSQVVNERITRIYTPSLEWINKLYSQISESRMLIKSWVHIDKIADTPDKLRLQQLHTTGYPDVIDTLMTLQEMWDSTSHQELLSDIHKSIVDSLFPKHEYIMSQLSTFESYDDPFIVFEVTPMTEDGGEVMSLTERILNKISQLQAGQEHRVNQERDKMVDQFKSFRKLIFIMLVALIIVSIIDGMITIRSLARPINKTKNILLQMSRGVLPKGKLTEGNDEVGQMSKALNQVVQGLKDITDFTVDIGKGNFDTEFHPLSEEDNLGHSLLEMREELKKAKKEEEKRQEENQQRNWASQGVAQFSDILRTNNDNLENLSYEVISNMVRYTKSNQGGIFIVNDNDPEKIYLEMTACYAFDRQKFMKMTFEVGEGLVGRCYQEKEKIYLTEIPEDYIKITSGLGENNPTCLLLIPLTYNDNIYGILEIASFNKYQDFEIEFIERIGENIAATISSVKSNIQTALLLEQSQQQAEEMSSQEEEMRQNMEELRATQEQSARREEELSREVESLRKQIQQQKLNV